ncbi:hypothetical protein DPMN_140898 [Dreissena polymorpha]|uniref:Uncharacterized protein n=1 Tax=Dreissena polymorpha TaxID=45954 RepID=A0A9D4JHT3_DREPO|nr:hypothetical protein DPMN_140898 [Dreissena polymorpha]
MSSYWMIVVVVRQKNSRKDERVMAEGAHGRAGRMFGRAGRGALQFRPSWITAPGSLLTRSRLLSASWTHFCLPLKDKAELLHYDMFNIVPYESKAPNRRMVRSFREKRGVDMNNKSGNNNGAFYEETVR